MRHGGQAPTVASSQPAVLVRDSKSPGGPQLTFAAASWRAFANPIRAADRLLTGCPLIRSRTKGRLQI
ncbi:MAG: DUF397 domain-containing protein [Actinobacteria bacterium]|nr:DUF397 domain-containing protein [Actinomycetota bacterium]